MPPKKKAKSSAAAKGAAAKASKSPCTLYFERLSAAVDKTPHGLGQMIIRGVKSDDEAESDEEEEETEAQSKARMDGYTKVQVAYMRHIVITQRRADSLEKMAKLVLGEQANHSFMAFNTSFS